MTPTGTARRARTAAAALALPLALALLVLSAPGAAGARRGKRKPTKNYCSSLERNCGFGPGGGGAWERNSASFVLETPEGGGDPVCSVTFDGGPLPTCRYDPDTAALMMRVECYSGTGHAVVQQACGPVVLDDEDLPVLDLFALPAPNQNQYENTGYCSAAVEAPFEGEPVEWFVQVFCTKYEEAVPAGASGAKAGSKQRPAVASFAQSVRSSQQRAAAAAAAKAKVAAAAAAGAAAGAGDAAPGGK